MCVHGTVAVELKKSNIQSNAGRKMGTIKCFCCSIQFFFLSLSLVFLFLWLWTSIFIVCLTMVVFFFCRSFCTCSRSTHTQFSVTNTKIEWNHPPNGVSFFFLCSFLSPVFSTSAVRIVLLLQRILALLPPPPPPQSPTWSTLYNRIQEELRNGGNTTIAAMNERGIEQGRDCFVFWCEESFRFP